MKLPAFYLLDAISKNVYNPYANGFAPFVVGVFLETYEQVDQSTRSKMEEMLLTWRTGSPNGRELFGVVPQLAIERQIGEGNLHRMPYVLTVSVHGFAPYARSRNRRMASARHLLFLLPRS